MNKNSITTYFVESTVEKRIVLLSDIHYYNKKNISLLKNIQTKVLKINPDFICIPGDFIDERIIYDKEYLLEFFTNLGMICPVIISLGNHEAKTRNDDMNKFDNKLLNSIKSIDNVYLLNNESWICDNIRFTGLTLPYLAYMERKDSYEYVLETLNKYFSNGQENDKYNIILSHSPYTLLYESVRNHPFYKSSDLILSGHTHGGLTPKWICCLIKRSLITPLRHLFPKNSYGYLKEEKTIISSGITKLSHFNPFRILNFLFKGEIVVIELKK